MFIILETYTSPLEFCYRQNESIFPRYCLHNYSLCRFRYPVSQASTDIPINPFTDHLGERWTQCPSLWLDIPKYLIPPFQRVPIQDCYRFIQVAPPRFLIRVLQKNIPPLHCIPARCTYVWSPNTEYLLIHTCAIFRPLTSTTLSSSTWHANRCDLRDTEIGIFCSYFTGITQLGLLFFTYSK